MSFRIFKIFVPVTFIVLLLVNVGFITMLADSLRDIAGYFPIPLEGIPIIAAQFGNSLVVFAIACNLPKSCFHGWKPDRRGGRSL